MNRPRTLLYRPRSPTRPDPRAHRATATRSAQLLGLGLLIAVSLGGCRHAAPPLPVEEQLLRVLPLQARIAQLLVPTLPADSTAAAGVERQLRLGQIGGLWLPGDRNRATVTEPGSAVARLLKPLVVADADEALRAAELPNALEVAVADSGVARLAGRLAGESVAARGATLALVQWARARGGDRAGRLACARSRARAGWPPSRAASTKPG